MDEGVIDCSNALFGQIWVVLTINSLHLCRFCTFAGLSALASKLALWLVSELVCLQGCWCVLSWLNYTPLQVHTAHLPVTKCAYLLHDNPFYSALTVLQPRLQGLERLGILDSSLPYRNLTPLLAVHYCQCWHHAMKLARNCSIRHYFPQCTTWDWTLAGCSQSCYFPWPLLWKIKRFGHFPCLNPGRVVCWWRHRLGRLLGLLGHLGSVPINLCISCCILGNIIQVSFMKRKANSYTVTI